MLEVGKKAPDFQATDQRGRRFSLSEATSGGPVVVYFYPRDFTPVCTQQACLFRDAYEDLTGVASEIVGVSLDGDESHGRFAERHGLPFPLVADQDKSIARAFGVLQLFGLFTKRVTFVIDRDMVVRGVFHHELSAQKHVDQVRDLLRELR